jgi:hypothetical protein
MMESADQNLQQVAAALPAISGEAIREPVLRRGYLWWRDLAAGQVPGAEHFSAEMLPDALLTHSGMIGWPSSDNRARFLFQGHAVAMLSGRVIVGTDISEIYPPGLLGPALDFLRLLAAAGCPLFADFRIGPDGSQAVDTRRLGLPFGDPARGTGGVLTLFSYRPDEAVRSAGVKVLQQRSQIVEGGLYRVIG